MMSSDIFSRCASCACTWSISDSIAERSVGVASLCRWNMSTCSGIGTSRSASELIRLVLPEPFVPISPYLKGAQSEVIRAI